MQTTASLTAETMALQRAVEPHRPVANRLFIDPYADPLANTKRPRAMSSLFRACLA